MSRIYLFLNGFTVRLPCPAVPRAAPVKIRAAEQLNRRNLTELAEQR